MTLLVHPFSRKNLESKRHTKEWLARSLSVGLESSVQPVQVEIMERLRLHWGTLALCWPRLLTASFCLCYSSWIGTGREAVSTLDGWSLCGHASEIFSKPNDAEPEAQEESSSALYLILCVLRPPTTYKRLLCTHNPEPNPAFTTSFIKLLRILLIVINSVKQ